MRCPVKKLYIFFLLLLLPLSCFNGLGDMYDDLTMKVPICVDNINGNNFNDGRGWKNAKLTIKAAFEVAEEGDEIWVAVNGSNLFDFPINKKVKFYGGFDGTESRKSERDRNSKTVINVSAPAYQVDIKSYDIYLEGFMITGTHACTAVQINSGYSVIFNDCDFSGNINSSATGGSVINCTGGRFGLNNCEFSNNNNSTGGINGGAIYCNGTSGSVKITDCRFENNKTTGANGGAIYCDNSSSFEITGTTFKSNSAGTNHYGGAIYSTSSILKVTDCLFDTNVANSSGGAIYSNADNVLVIKETTFKNNTSSTSYAGGIYSDKSKLIISNSFFNGNTSLSPGGALYISGDDGSGSSIIIVNTLFSNNQCTDPGWFGGGIYFIASSDTPEMYMSNCTFYNNTGSGTSSGSLFMIDTTSYISNSLFYENSGSYSIQGGTAYINNCAWDDGENSIGDPVNTQLLTPSQSPFISTVYGNADFLKLSSGSVCIDEGTDNISIPGFIMPSTDLAGNPRKVGTIDIGCYERQ